QEQELASIPAELDPALVKQGLGLYTQWCSVCHGAGAESGGVLPDLRKSKPEVLALPNLKAVVLQGAYQSRGMPNLSQWVREPDVEAIHAYLLARRAALVAERAATTAGAGAGPWAGAPSPRQLRRSCSLPTACPSRASAWRRGRSRPRRRRE